jgi:hypothetical protein
MRNREVIEDRILRIGAGGLGFAKQWLLRSRLLKS